MAIDWKEPMLDDTLIHQYSIHELPADEEKVHLAAKHYTDQCYSVMQNCILVDVCRGCKFDQNFLHLLKEIVI